jgi:hypothetical protein
LVSVPKLKELFEHYVAHGSILVSDPSIRGRGSPNCDRTALRKLTPEHNAAIKAFVDHWNSTLGAGKYVQPPCFSCQQLRLTPRPVLTLLVVLASSSSGDHHFCEFFTLYRPPPHQDWGRARTAGNRFARDDKEPGPSWVKQLPGERPRETAET